MYIAQKCGTVQQYTDSELVENIRHGDIKSFEQVFTLYGDRLIRYAFSILKDNDEAQDLVQQLFIVLWTKREQMDVNTSLKSYLYKSVYNAALNKIKQRNVRESYAQYVNYTADGKTQAASFAIENKEIRMAIENAVNDLPEQCRIIFRMSKFDLLKYQQIADQLGLSVKTVENQMGKALKHMRLRLSEYLPAIILFLLFDDRPWSIVHGPWTFA